MQTADRDQGGPKQRLFRKELVFAALTFLACSINLGVASNTSPETNILKSFTSFSFEHLLLFPGLVFLYLAIGKRCFRTPRLKKTPCILALLFAFFMLFGRAFEKWDSCTLLFQVRNGQFIKSILFFTGYAVLFYHLICFLFDLLDRICARAGAAADPGRRIPRGFGWYIRALSSRPFLTVFLTLLAFSIPNLIMSYPGRIMGDTPPQIVQAFSELRTTGFPYLDAGNRLLKDGVYINQHHPAAHTLLLHGCLLLGDAVTGSLNSGLFLYVLLQAVVLTASYAYACSVMIRKAGLTTAGILMTVLYAVIHPMIINYTFLVTKDTLYAALILVCLIHVFQLLSGDGSRRRLILTGLSMLGVTLFRNEGRYILYLFLLLTVLLHRESRKRCACLLLGVAVFSSCVFHLIYPALGFTPGSRREMLSVPFQQTARYVKQFKDQITDEERAAIDRVLVYEGLEEKYSPAGRVDLVKDTFREESTGKDLKAYLAAWAQMFRKHPGTYLQATMNHYYLFFYPGKARLGLYTNENSREYMDQVNPLLNRIGKTISLPESLAWMRRQYDKEVILLMKAPIFSILFTPAFYSWILILLLSWTVSRKRRGGLCMLLIPMIVLAVNLVGPCNANYARYLFPVIFSMPMILWMTIRLSSPVPAS